MDVYLFEVDMFQVKALVVKKELFNCGLCNNYKFELMQILRRHWIKDHKVMFFFKKRWPLLCVFIGIQQY